MPGYGRSKEALAKLSPEQFRITQHGGTEPPGSGELLDNQAAGIYVDIVSGEPLFASSDKFDAHSGWPSFTQPIARHHINQVRDTSLGMERTEVRSVAGDTHLGHVFSDGPKERGGLRYCINSASIRFIPREKMDAEGYSAYLDQVQDKA